MQQFIPSVLSSNVGGKGSIRINKSCFALNGEVIAQYGVYILCCLTYNELRIGTIIKFFCIGFGKC